MNEMRSRGVRRLHVGNGTEQYKHTMGGVETQLTGIGAARGAAAFLARLPIMSVERMTMKKKEGSEATDAEQ